MSQMMTDNGQSSRPPPLSAGAEAHQGLSPMPAADVGVPPPQALRGIDSLGFVMDVPVELRVEIGRRTMRIAEVLRLGPGSILELSKANGEPLDVYVNDRLVAQGEAVVVGERYGIRITEVLVMDEIRGRKGTP